MELMKKGFTLAEVLITLVVIGAVAATTIPSLVNNIGDQQNKVAWKKAFSDISQVTMRVIIDNGGNLTGVFNSSVELKNQYSRYLNYVKNCDSHVSTNDCWHKGNSWKSLDGTLRESRTEPGIVLNNGNLLFFMWHSSYTCTQDNLCGTIVVDVNGFNKPNVIGKDIFQAFVYSNRLSPPIDVNCNNSTGSLAGWGCSADYLYQ